MESNQSPSQVNGPDSFVGSLFADRYRVTRVISEGAKTLIADAIDEQTGRNCTLKIVRARLSAQPAVRERFDEMMRGVAAMSHPNIAAVYDWGFAPIGSASVAYVVVEQLTGGSLRDMFDRGRRLSPSQGLTVGLEACRALDYAHRRGFVHGELTPAKIVFGDDRRLRIIDFGLSELLSAEAWEHLDSLPTHIAWYAAPEQGPGQIIDGKADIYALSLILHEAVTGTLPFKSDSTVATLAARQNKLMPVSADLGPLAAILERSGRPEPSERSSASDLGAGLVKAASKLPRPEPLPLLSAGLFEVPAEELRAPHDPTGGILRPQATTGAAVRVVTPDEPKDVSKSPRSGDAGRSDAGRGDVGSDDGHLALLSDAPTVVMPVVVPTEPSKRPPRQSTDPVATTAPTVPKTAAPFDAPRADTARPDDAVADEKVSRRKSSDDAAATQKAPRKTAARKMAARKMAARKKATGAGSDAHETLPAAKASNEKASNEERGNEKGSNETTTARPSRRNEGRSAVAADSQAVTEAIAITAAPVVPDPPVIIEAEPDLELARPAADDLVIVPIADGGSPTSRPTPPDVSGREPGPAAAAPTTTSTMDWSDQNSELDDDETDSSGRRGRTLKILAGVVIAAALIGLGGFAYTMFRPSSHPVPNLVGVPEAQASAQVEPYGWVVTVQRERSDEVPTVGQVVRTVPAAGVEVPKGDPFLLVISDGPVLRVLPNLIGMTSADAQTQLRDLQLNATVTNDFDETVPVDSVISWSVEGQPGVVAGDTIAPDSTVNLVVSKGPAPRAVPNIVGHTSDEAAKMLGDLGLVPTESGREFSDDVPAGVVIRQTPAPDTSVARDSAVTFVVSNGPDLVTFPTFEPNLTYNDVYQRLIDAGFQVHLAFGDAQGVVSKYEINGQPAEAGQTFKRGTQVDITAL